MRKFLFGFLSLALISSLNARIIEIEIDDSRLDKLTKIIDILNEEDNKPKIIITDRGDKVYKKDDDWKPSSKKSERASKNQCREWERQCDKWEDICDDIDDDDDRKRNQNLKSKCKNWERQCDRWEDLCDDWDD